MRTILIAATVMASALTALAPIDPARAAETKTKPRELATIGEVVHPDRLAAGARYPMLARVPGSSSTTIATTDVAASKREAFETSLPFDPTQENAEQRAKLAAGMASALEPAPTHDLAGAKPENLSTVLPQETGVPSPSIDDLMRMKLRFRSIDAPSSRRPGASSLTGSLGVIPRPEWSGLKEKPKDVSTIETAPSSSAPTAPPSAIELQRRAARSADLKGAAPRKAAAVTTSRPRDPSLPAPSATKSPATESKPEVQP